MRTWYAWRNSLWPIVVGVSLVVFGVYGRLLSLRSRDWPVAQGVITQSFLRSKHDALSGGRRSTGATITYRYTVDGKTYTGDLISYGQMLLASESHRVQRYPQGSAVDVHYDPKDPALAVLEAGAGPAPGLIILAGLGLVGYGVWKGRD